MNKQPTVEQLFALNANLAWRSRVNCYAYALGVDHNEAMAATGAAHPGCFSRTSWRQHALQDLLGGHLALTHYYMLTDGLVYLGDTVPTCGNHIIAACIANPGFHFFRRDERGRWSHKVGSKAASHRFAGQSEITVIERSAEDYRKLVPDAVFTGYYEVTPNRPRLDDRSRLIYDPRTEQQLIKILDDAGQSNIRHKRSAALEKRLLKIG